MTNDLFSRNRLAGHETEAMASIDALVVGAGALAQNTVLTLGLEGPERLRIVDRDTWSDHNATRSPLYGSPDVREQCDHRKAATVAHELRRMTAWNPDLKIEYACRWIQELGDSPFREASVVVSCVDDPAARAHLATMCHRHGTPMVEGGLSGSAGAFAVYAETDGPCWQCGAPIPTGVRVPAGCDANAIEQARQGYLPMTQPIASILGAYMAEAVIQLAHGDKSLSGKRIYIDDIRQPATTITSETRSQTCPCPHELLGEPHAEVDADEQTTVAELLGILDETIDEPRVWLRSAFIGREICPGRLDSETSSCGRLIDVGVCGWELRRHPRCKECGGDCPRSHHDRLAVLHELSSHDADWSGLAISRFGFVNGDSISVEDRHGVVRTVTLGGEPEAFSRPSSSGQAS